MLSVVISSLRVAEELACLLFGRMMPFLDQTAGLCRGKGTSVFSHTRGSEMVVLQGIEDPRGSRDEGDGYLHWDAKDDGGQGLCKVQSQTGTWRGDGISAVLS